MVQGVAVSDINEGPAAAELWQRGKVLWFFLRPKKISQSGFDKLGHRAALAGGLALQLCHHRVIDIERGLHMGNHNMRMEILRTGQIEGLSSRAKASW